MSKKITAMDALSNIATGDLFEIVDISETNLRDKNKKVDFATLNKFISQGGSGTAYDAGFAYVGGTTYYRTYNGNIWQFISPTNQTGVTPGTNAAVWDLVYVGEMMHVQNTDLGTDNSYFYLGASANRIRINAGALEVSTNSGGLWSPVASGALSDVAYDATSWNGNTDGATKNALRDKFVLVDAAILAAVSDTAYNAGTWDGVTGIAPSKNAVRDKFVSVDANFSNYAELAGATFSGAFSSTSVGAGRVELYQEGLYFVNIADTFSIKLGSVDATSDKVILLPDTSGTVALISDLAAYLKLDGSNDPITGAIAITDNTAASSYTTGSLIVTGGISSNSTSYFLIINSASVTSNSFYFPSNAGTSRALTVLPNSGTDINGTPLLLQPGAATGSGASPNLIFYSGPAVGASGTTVRSVVERGKITSNGYESAYDVEITDSAKGIILRDSGDASRRRITSVNGVLTVSAAL